MNTPTTVADLVDEVQWSGLYRLDQMPLFMRLDIALTTSTTIFTYAGIDFEDESALHTNMIVEVNSELMLVTSIDKNQNSGTLRRGMFGTKPAAHAQGDLMIVNPKFPRHKIEQVVGNAIVNLSPPLFRVVNTHDVSPASTPIDAPADLHEPVQFVYEYGGEVTYGAVQVIDPWPNSNTDVGLLFPGVPAGANGHLKYLATFTYPTSTTESLTDLGLEPEHQRLVVVDAMIEFADEIDLDAVNVDYLSEWMSAQTVPPTTGAQLRQEFIRKYEYLLQRARRRQATKHRAVQTTANGIMLP